MGSESLIRLLLPGVTGFLAAAQCPVRPDTAASIKARPPGYVFRIVWPILYLTIGYVWVRVADKPYADLIFGANVTALAGWLVLNGCLAQRSLALYLITVTLGLAIFTVAFVLKYDTRLALVILPYMSWMLIATLLSWADVLSMLSA